MKQKTPFRNIFLTGFMGVGKTTIGALLAQSLGWTFVDLDVEIEAASQMDIATIFRTRGEKEFREIENETLSKFLSASQQVISLGGGSLLNETNRLKIHQSGVLIYLFADFSTLVARLSNGKQFRPLINLPENNGNTDLETDMNSNDFENQIFENQIKNLLNQRKPAYETAHFQVQTDHQTLTEIVTSILNRIDRFSTEKDYFSLKNDFKTTGTVTL